MKTTDEWFKSITDDSEKAGALKAKIDADAMVEKARIDRRSANEDARGSSGFYILVGAIAVVGTIVAGMCFGGWLDVQHERIRAEHPWMVRDDAGTGR